MRKWTPSEEAAILRAVENSPDDLRLAFRELADSIDRTPDAIVTRYYNKLLGGKKEECDLCGGTGEVEKTIHRGPEGMQIEMDVMVTCQRCDGTGIVKM
jgi:DnaJ-class molecular chaperone